MKSVVQGVKPVLESLDIGVVSFFSPRPNCCILQTINDTAIQYLGLKGTSFKSEQVLSLLHLHPSRLFAGCREQEVGGSSFQIETDKGRTLHLTVYQIPEEQQVVVLIAPAFPYKEAAYPVEERTHDLLFVLDEEYRIKKIFANLMEQHLRLPVNMILGKIITDFFDESTAQKIRITLERANVTKSKQSLFYHSPLESDERSFKATIHWIMQDQKPVCYFAVDDVSATVDFSVVPRSESSNGILVTNEDGIIEFADSVCTRIFALEKDVLEGSDVHSLFSVETEDPSCKVCYQSPQGRNKDLRVRIAPFPGNTKHAHYIFRISDQSKTNANDTTVFVNLLLNLTFQLLQTPVETSDEVLLHILRELGEFSKSDRTYIFLCSPEDSTISNTHEWCAPGVSRQKNLLQNIPYHMFPQWMETLHHGQEIYILSVANLSDSWKAERESLILQDIKSILIEPITASQQLIGFVGFDTVWDYKDWPENVRDLLHFFAHILGAFFARVQSEKRLKECLQRSRALVREKEDINYNMQNFYAKISHDIRTSLNAIVSTGKLLEQSALDSIQNNYVSMINASSMFLKNLLNDLLDFSTFSREGFEIRTQQISVWEVVKNSVDALRVLALEKGLSITVEYEEIIPVHLYGDGVRLTQILINLLHNAVKYSSHGLIQVSVGMQRLSGKDALLEFVVMDQGKGMDKGMVQSLFPYGGKTPVPSPDGGYGLGLSIVKQLIDAMHGSISVESAPGEGSTFSFVLPFALAGASTRMTSLRDPLGCPSVVFVGNPSHEANAFLSLLEKRHLRILRCTSLQQIPERNVYIVVVQEQMLQQHNSLKTFGQIQKARNPPFLCFLYAQRFERANYEQYKAYVTIHGFFLETQPMMLWYLEMFKKLNIMEKPESLLSMYDFSTIRVLVVDDTSINLEILKYKLESMQVTVETAKTGKDALRILKKASFDIIFMDLHLPGLDGIQTTEMIRAFAKDVWVVALSAYISETEKAHCRRVGIEEYLRKPVEQGDLIEILCRYTARKTE